MSTDYINRDGSIAQGAETISENEKLNKRILELEQQLAALKNEQNMLRDQ